MSITKYDLREAVAETVRRFNFRRIPAIATADGNEIYFEDGGEYGLMAVVGVEREETILETVLRERVGWYVVWFGEDDSHPCDECGGIQSEPHWYAYLDQAYAERQAFQARADALKATEFLGSPGPVRLVDTIRHTIEG